MKYLISFLLFIYSSFVYAQHDLSIFASGRSTSIENIYTKQNSSYYTASSGENLGYGLEYFKSFSIIEKKLFIGPKVTLEHTNYNHSYTSHFRLNPDVMSQTTQQSKIRYLSISINPSIAYNVTKKLILSGSIGPQVSFLTKHEVYTPRWGSFHSYDYFDIIIGYDLYNKVVWGINSDISMKYSATKKFFLRHADYS